MYQVDQVLVLVVLVRFNIHIVSDEELAYFSVRSGPHSYSVSDISSFFASKGHTSAGPYHCCAYVLSGVSYVLGSDSQRVGHISVNQKT
jgi:hypothetical protein